MAEVEKIFLRAAVLDGVLFVDEAYSLAQGGQADYGQGVIATLVQKMERWRERLVVMVAGYGVRPMVVRCNDVGSLLKYSNT